MSNSILGQGLAFASIFGVHLPPPRPPPFRGGPGSAAPKWTPRRDPVPGKVLFNRKSRGLGKRSYVLARDAVNTTFVEDAELLVILFCFSLS